MAEVYPAGTRIRKVKVIEPGVPVDVIEPRSNDPDQRPVQFKTVVLECNSKTTVH